jgi:hypothetical protein
MKKFKYVLLSSFLTVGLTACNGDSAEQPPTDVKEPATEIEKEREQKGEANAGKQQDDQIDQSYEDVPAQYVGQIDPHSVEMIVEGKPTAFQLGEGVTLENIKDGDKVIISYVKETKESVTFNVLTKISKAGDAADSAAPNRPQTQNLTLTLEGMKEEREARLYESKNGFSLYLLEGFTMKEPERGKSVLQMDYDPDFHVEIRFLPRDINHDELEKTLTAELQQYGTVHKVNPAEHFDPYYHNAYLYLIASASNKGSVLALVQDVEDDLVQYTMHMPLKEAAEGAGPAFWAMLKTLETQDQ